MASISENIAQNIAKLRKANKLTQNQLAEKLNYSDKAVSKWERGDSTPDIEMLCEIASLFNVDIDYLTKPHTDLEIRNSKDKTQIFIRSLLILIMVCLSVLLVSTFVFVGCVIKDSNLAKSAWICFVAATPICSHICAVFAKKQNLWLMQLICYSLLVWTIATTAFCFTIIFGLSKFWLLFIAAIPIQAALCIHFFLKKPI